MVDIDNLMLDISFVVFTCTGNMIVQYLIMLGIFFVVFTCARIIKML